MTPSVMLNMLLAVGYIATFGALLRANIRKETVAQQSELIMTLQARIDEQHDIIGELSHRVKMLEGEIARSARVV